MTTELGWRDSQVPLERCAERVGVVVADAVGDMRIEGVCGDSRFEVTQSLWYVQGMKKVESWQLTLLVPETMTLFWLLREAQRVWAVAIRILQWMRVSSAS